MSGQEQIRYMEVYTRQPCSYYACEDGMDTQGDNPADTCPSCEGAGYVEKWVNLKELLRAAINI